MDAPRRVVFSLAAFGLVAVLQSSTALAVDVVEVQIESAKITNIPAGSPCLQNVGGVIVMPGTPVSIDLGCTVVTATVDGGMFRIVTEPPQGNINPFIDIKFSVPGSQGSLTPVVFECPFGVEIISLAGVVGGNHLLYAGTPCNNRFTIPLIAGDFATLHIQAGITSFGGYTTEVRMLTTVASEVGVADLDSDGVPDSIDACPNTPAGASVDSAGCSQPQFCASKEISDFQSFLSCAAADWKNDEPLVWAGDCHPVSAGGSWSSFTCQAR